VESQKFNPSDLFSLSLSRWRKNYKKIVSLIFFLLFVNFFCVQKLVQFLRLESIILSQGIMRGEEGKRVDVYR
jgi:hypothetical protein